MSDSSKMTDIWGRFGISLNLTPEEMQRLVYGSREQKQRTIDGIFRDGRAVITGECYIPGSVVKEYNDVNDTTFEEDDIDLDVDRLEGKALRVKDNNRDRGDAR